MTDSQNMPAPTLCLAESEYLAFTAVAQTRKRGNGWSPIQQERFILALEVMGSVRPAARAVGMSRASAYKLRDRPDAESFARSWDLALEIGRQRQFDCAMDQAINGVTTIHVRRGGSVTVKGGPDMRLIHSAIRSEDHASGLSPLKRQS
jgi:hypothetical protein